MSLEHELKSCLLSWHKAYNCICVFKEKTNYTPIYVGIGEIHQEGDGGNDTGPSHARR